VVKETVWQELHVCLTNPVFVLTTLGYGAYTFVLAGLAFYAPTFIQVTPQNGSVLKLVFVRATTPAWTSL
jgi:hypothetical protein